MPTNMVRSLAHMKYERLERVGFIWLGEDKVEGSCLQITYRRL